MKYFEAKKFLNSLLDYEKKRDFKYTEKTFNLKHCRNFLKEIGNPEEKLKVIHLAGSKGKGSTAKLIAEGLVALGFKVGLYLSPALFETREKISINGKIIPKQKFASYVSQLKNRAQKHLLTHFEFLTVLAFLYFAEQKVDFAVLETGLGGRLDATNVVEKPFLTVLCPIEFEHTQHLGRTLEKIAREKLGIAKKDVPLVCGIQEPEVKKIVREICERKKAPLIFAPLKYRYRILDRDKNGYFFELRSKAASRKIRLGLLGEHQVQNALLAWVCLEKLWARRTGGQDCLSRPGRRAGLPAAQRLSSCRPPARPGKFNPQKIIRAWAKIKFPGRFEIKKLKKTDLILDGAHTPKSAQALRKTLDEVYPGKKVIFVLGFLKDKKVEKITKILVRKSDRAIPVSIKGERGFSSLELAGILKKIGILKTEPEIESPKKALETAEKMAGSDSIICLTGSFHLLKEL